VNPLLRGLGLPVFCGAGNANLLAAVLQRGLGLPDQRRLRVLAHHRHLYGLDDPEGEVRAWLDGQPIGDVASLLRPVRVVGRDDRNPVSGRAAAAIVAHIVANGELLTSVPGPLGLPGGYPVRISGARIDLNLPPGLDVGDAIAWNRRQSLLDGADVGEDGEVRFAPSVAEELARSLPELAHGFPASRAVEACWRVDELRQRVRATGCR
jgi:hypothetical protein